MKAAWQPGKQARSRATQDRILKATEDLLRKEPFEAISIRRILAAAKTTTGSFYARFRDKDALLPVLYEANETRLERKLARLRVAVAAAKSLEKVAALVTDHIVEFFGTAPNLSRAVFEYASREPNSDFAKTHSSRRTRQYAFMVEGFLRFDDEINHPAPARAVELALYFVAVTCRNRFFYPLNPPTRTLKVSNTELRSELTRMLLGYLRI